MRARARGGALAGLLLAAFASAPGAQTNVDQPTRAEAEAFLAKIARIRDGRGKAPVGTFLTTVGQQELTAWLTFNAPEYLPTGVVQPTIQLVGEGRLQGSAIVDLDAVRLERRSGSWFDPVNLLRGSVTISAAGRLQTTDGLARFFFESASVGVIPIPKSFLQQVVSHYTRTDEDPDGVGLDDPYPMPAEIREIRVEAQKAHVVQ